MQFCFRLMPVATIAPWRGEQNLPCLHWFGLTQGWFWITVHDQELFRYSSEVQRYWQQQTPSLLSSEIPYEDYPVARYWEDLLEMLPVILDPLPDDLALRVADVAEWEDWCTRARRWQEESTEDASWDVYYTAVHWWEERQWDLYHLAHPPRIWLWRTGDTIHIRWDNRDATHEGIPVWHTQQGEATLPVTEFLVAVESFNTRFITEMGVRVDAIRHGFSHPNVAIDGDTLEREQQARSGLLANLLSPFARQQRQTCNWDEVQSAILSLVFTPPPLSGEHYPWGAT